jgi:phage baseplate assembly protein W
MIRSAAVYPLQVVDGKLKLTDDYPELVKQAIVHTVNTKLGELVWHPEYGTGYLVFDKSVPEVLRQLREALEFSLKSYPQVSFKLYAQPSDDGRLNALVTYQTPDGISTDVTIVLR